MELLSVLRRRVAIFATASAIATLAFATGCHRRPAPPSTPPTSTPPRGTTPREVAEATLSRHGIRQARAIAAFAEPAVRIDARRTPLADLALGASRFGGAPDVPPDFVWPAQDGHPLTFLAQIDLAAAHATEGPEHGWLLFFYDAERQPWGFNPTDAGSAAVVHVDVEVARLVRATPPVAQPDYENGMRNDASSLAFTRTVTIPDPFDRILEPANIRFGEVDYIRFERAETALAGIDSEQPHHHLFGHPQLVQNDMRGECELVTNGLYTGDSRGYESARGQELLRDAASKWRLLLQLDSDEAGPGWMWGDIGRIYFWIRNDDLAQRRFDRVWLILQCG